MLVNSKRRGAEWQRTLLFQITETQRDRDEPDRALWINPSFELLQLSIRPTQSSPHSRSNQSVLLNHYPGL